MWNDKQHAKVRTIAYDKLIRSTDKMYHVVGFRLVPMVEFICVKVFVPLNAIDRKYTQMLCIFIESQNNTRNSNSNNNNIQTMLIAIPYKKLLIEFNWDYAKWNILYHSFGCVSLPTVWPSFVIVMNNEESWKWIIRIKWFEHGLALSFMQ